MPYELYTEELGGFLLNATAEQIEEMIEDIHPADILDIIRCLEEEQQEEKLKILHKLPEWVIASIIDQAENEEKYELLTLFPEAKKKEIVDEMSSDELVDLLATITPDEANEILTKMDHEDAQEVRELLTYAPDTAGGIMATEYISIQNTMTIEETLGYLRKEAPEAESAYYIYVLDHQDILKGVVSLRDIVTSDLDTKVEEIVNENVISIPVDMDQEEVGHLFEKYGFLTMPVVDEEDKMLGIVTVDDIMEILRNENTEDIYRLAGLQEDEKVEGTLRESVEKRIPWIFVNLITASIASSAVALFEGTLAKATALAIFMPIVAGLGGNTGTQTLTLIVRGLALGELEFEDIKKVLLKEVGTGIALGLSAGLTMAIIASILRGNPVLGFVIAGAMILNMTVAAFVGVLVPFILKKLKIDPALASSIFVTMCTDMLGFFFLLGLATVFIDYLV